MISRFFSSLCIIRIYDLELFTIVVVLEYKLELQPR
jgi:hypothetical protein